MIGKNRFYLLQSKRLKFCLLPHYTKISARIDYKKFLQSVERIGPYIGDIHGKRVLDVGCGVRFPITLLFHSLGVDVVGIDIAILGHGASLVKYRNILARQGGKRLLARLVTDFFEGTVYYRELQRVAGMPLRFKQLDLRVMDVAHTAFGEEEFDLVVSNAVLEHIKNVDEVLVEMKRTMKRGAIAYITFHLFPSLTGGHNTLWSNPDTQQVVLGGIPPWDHLRKQQYPINPRLNRWKEERYRDCFNKHFKVLEWITQYKEPECYLTQELSLELKDYSREELLKREIIVIARKA